FLGEVGDAVELGCAAQPAGQVVGPTVIAAAQLGARAVRLVDDLGRLVAADVMKGAEHALVVAHDQDRLAGDFGCEKGSWRRDLGTPSRHLPTAAEDAAALGLVDLRVKIPRAGNGAGLFQRQRRIEGAKLFGKRGHATSLSPFWRIRRIVATSMPAACGLAGGR